MPRAIVGIGGNLGAVRSIFACAQARLELELGGTLSRSRLYASAAVGPKAASGLPQPDYLNGAFAIEFEGRVDDLFALMVRTERWLGRVRRERWGARTLDLDLLEWSEGAIHTASLDVPHPELHARAFALAPLLDVAPDLEPRYAAALAALGGPPPRAVPGWLAPGEVGFIDASVGLAALDRRAGWLVRMAAEGSGNVG